jgi:hypothetical protein
MNHLVSPAKVPGVVTRSPVGGMTALLACSGALRGARV